MNEFDTFQAENRQRINIMNIHFSSIEDEHFDQNLFSRLKKDQRCFQVCQIFSNNSSSYGNVEYESDDFN